MTESIDRVITDAERSSSRGRAEDSLLPWVRDAGCQLASRRSVPGRWRWCNRDDVALTHRLRETMLDGMIGNGKGAAGVWPTTRLNLSVHPLVLAMLDELMDDFERAVLAPSLEGPGSIRERVDAFVQAIHAFEAAVQRESGHLPGCPFGNLIVETGTYSPGLRQAVKRHLERVAGHFQRCLREGVDRGELPPQIDARALAERWLALMEGILVMAKVDQDPATILRLGPALHVLIGVSGPRANADDQPRAAAGGNASSRESPKTRRQP